tara:strand:- start:580 stop:1068 length:489 start_codon:yes stop_codon:yes gene_type:complete
MDKNKIEAVNNLNKYINKKVPQIMNILKEGYKLKSNGELFKKYEDKIYNIIYKNKPNNIRCFISDTKYSSLLKIDISYKTGEFSNSYIKDYIYLFTNDTKWCDLKNDFIITNSKLSKSFNKKPVKTIKQVKTQLNKINKINNKIELLNKQISNLKSGFNNFV